MKIWLKAISLIYFIYVTNGCATSEKEDVKLSAQEKQVFLANARMPQLYGFRVAQTKAGIACIGAARLHPNHYVEVDIPKKSDNVVVEMRGRSRHMKMNALIDLSSSSSWVEFDTACEFEAKPLGINNVIFPYRGGYNTGATTAYAAVITQLRIKHFFMENIPLYVRMARGSVGPLSRGIDTPRITGVLGYDNLSQMEYIQFDFQNRKVRFSATRPYVPDERMLLSSASIVDVSGFGLAVHGYIDGEERDIIIDPIGDYSLARSDSTAPITKQLELGGVVVRRVPTYYLRLKKENPPRVGKQVLSKYLITVCPQKRVVYFERPMLYNATHYEYP